MSNSRNICRIQPGVLVSFMRNPFGSKKSLRRGIVTSEVFLKNAYLVEVLYKGKIKTIEIDWIKEIHI